MKKIGIILLAFVMSICLFPLSVTAAETNDFNTDLAAYLTQISSERGKEVTKDDLEYVLNIYSESLSDFDSVAGLKDFLGEVIKSDYSNLTSIYEEYSLDKDSLTALLHDKGETLEDYTFLNELDAGISSYQGGGTVTQETGFEEKLTAYLNDISTTRGFTVSREMIEAYLSQYEIPLSSFETVDELKDFLGDVIKSDLSNLDYFQTEYGLSREDIDSRLSTINKTLNDYVFIDNLEFTILENDDGKISYTYFMSFLEESFPGITKKLGMTEEEYKKTYQYFMSMEDYYYSEETQDKLIDILMRFQTLAETFSESGKDATLDQLTQLQNLYQDLQDVLKIKFSYSVLENGKKVPLTLLDLMNGKDLENATISITLYTDASEFLMDFNLSADMFGEVIGDVEKTPVTKPEASNDKTTSVTVKTVTGGKLPKTASNYTAMVLAGAFLVLLGTVLFKTNGKEKDEAKTL